jgi:hypothetical protein
MMSRAQVLCLHLSLFLTTATGVVFACMKYFLKPADEFAVVNHPLQPWMLSSHVVVAPLLVFALGWIFGDHILPKMQMKSAPARRSGVWSAILIAPMVVSGYLLQVSTSDTMRTSMAASHWIASALFVGGYVAHLVSKPSINR